VRETIALPIAFAARLTPAAPAAASPAAPVPIPPAAANQPLTAEHTAAAPDASVTRQKASPESTAERPVQRMHKPEAEPRSDRDPSPESQDGSDGAQARIAALAPQPAARHASATETPAAEPTSPRPAEAVHTPAERPPSAEPSAREIRLELGGSGQRVEVRLAERAGEVRVSVRTPDGALAESLRDHLPNLSTRLEQTGFRADQWRAADGGGGTRPIDVPRAAGGGAGEARQQHSDGGGQEPRDQSGRQREPRGDGQPNRNQKGKGFAWLMSSLE
jgi:hypothetical protein